ncbi:glucose 1-dehydrogenase [Acrocarpospora macrocephala]|uniref:Oxidoreductase n=1 Tax=Acrocarpospora macrocephala TaxID=150177 RepID=A0A5M3X181_9ACTN|nr:SDR family oxidoreductase [Acrocarpospora macrocephala]GES14750.1 oxidoreductase [Acrocarpospora macrocephala]
MSIVITGAASGIGRAVAELAARPGAELVLADRDAARLDETAELVRARGARALPLVVDLATPEAADEIVAAAAEEYGAIAAVVSNAGLIVGAPLAEMSADSFDLSFAVNARATWLLGRAAYPLLKRSRGALVATASMAATHPTPGTGAYSASKAAVVMLVKQMALEWGPDGIRCNTVSPGPTLSGMTKDVFADLESFEQRANREAREAHIPLRRVGTAEDVARAVLFLAGDDARHITGVDLMVDGGLSTALMPAVGGGTGHPATMREQSA